MLCGVHCTLQLNVDVSHVSPHDVLPSSNSFEFQDKNEMPDQAALNTNGLEITPS